MQERVEQLEKEIQEIQDRNKRVEADKTWETSWFRKILIVAVTYIMTSLVFYFIGINDFLLNALIPTVAYVLSIQSLPIVKKWWIKRYLKG